MSCADCNQGCNCRIVAGTGATVTGSGLASDPYVIATSGPVAPNWSPTSSVTWSTASISLASIAEPTVFEVLLSANVTSITLPSWAASVSGVLSFIVTNSSTFTITWPGVTTQNVPINQTTGIDLVHLMWTGQRWLAIQGGADFS